MSNTTGIELECYASLGGLPSFGAARRYIIVYCILAPGPGRRPQLLAKIRSILAQKHFVGSATFGPIVALPPRY